MVDLTTTQLQAKGGTPSTTRKGGQAEATTTKPSNMPPLPFTDGVNMLYHQLVECACWHWSSPTPNTAYVGASGWGPTVEASAARMG
jgi:hypothetical protein